MKKTYYEWIEKNCSRLDKQTVIVTGGDGTIGRNICDYLGRLGANIIIASHDINECEKVKNNLLEKYPNNLIEAKYIDLSKNETIYAFIETVKKYNPKYLINNAGVFHLPKIINDDGNELTFSINYLGAFILIEGLKDLIKNNDGKIVNVGSISMTWYRNLDLSDLQYLNGTKKTKRYARTKAMLALNTLRLKKEGYPIDIAHPGGSITSLFDAKRGGFTKAFNKTIVPLARHLLPMPNKVALSIIYTLTHELEYGFWCGPKGAFKIYGYPGVYKLTKHLLDEKIQDYLYKQTITLLK